MHRRLFTLALLCLALSGAGNAANTLVNSITAFNAAIAAAAPGDTVTLANQVWTNVIFTITSKNGTAQLPIVIRAQSYGGVTITGTSYFRMSGSYLVVEGLIFKNAVPSSGHVFEFRTSSSTLANNSRLTRCAFINCNPPSSSTTYHWTAIYGKYNRVDHCYYRGKNHVNATVAVIRNGHVADYHQIDSNYFGYRPPLGVNGGETIRVGTSTYSLSGSFTTVEYNYFEKTNGEAEIISNKSCDNIYRYNTFNECEGTLTLRHGNRCQVYGNFFFGNRKSNTGAIRIIGEDHLVYNNYISGITGSDLRSAISIMDGCVITDTTDPTQLTTYFPVKRARILFNTIVDCKYNLTTGSGRDADNIVKPDSILFANNIFRGVSGNLTSPMIIRTDTATNVTWQGNFISGTTLGISPTPAGISTSDPTMTKGSDGFYRPSSSSIVINAAQGSYPWLTTDMDGQPRDGTADAGADEYSAGAITIRPMTSTSAGPGNVSYSTGNWSDTLTWMYNALPTSTMNITVAAGTTVTLDAASAVCASLTVDGMLNFSNSTSARALTVGGDVTISSSGTIAAPARATSGTELLHTLSLTGNLINLGTFDMRGGSGTTAGSNTINAVNLNVNGSRDSYMSVGEYSSSNNEFNGITVNKTNGARLILNSNVTLNAAGSVNPPNFTLSSGIVVTGAYNLIILSNGASVSSGTTTAYVQGTMGRAFPSTGGSRSFPIGDASMFRPLTVRTTSSGITSGHYLLASVTKQPANTGGSVFSGGIDFVSNVRHWKLTYYQNTSTTNSLTFDNFSLSYGADDKLITGQSNFCAALSENARGSWSGIGPENHVVSIGSSPTVMQSNTISVSPPALQDNGSLYLALAKTTGSRGFVTPLRVNAAAEGLTNGASSVNDTFMVELKNITSPYATHQQSRALSNNGENYYADLSVPIPGTYYIAIRNRNSLETWSAAPVDFNGDSASYDFTASASNAYGGNMKYKAPRWCLYSGDINNDGIIDFTDILLVDNDQYNFTAGYVITDVTGDNFVDYSDMSIVENNSNSFIVRQYPGAK